MEKVILIIVLFICLITDLRSRKILNVITIPAIILGLIINFITMGFDGFLFSGKGLAVGLGLLFIPFLLGGMGAGDVKLMAAIGAIMGTTFVLYSFIYTALIGGIIALILIIKKYGVFNIIKITFFNLVYLRSIYSVSSSRNNSNILFPYGVAIFLGTLFTLVRGEF